MKINAGKCDYPLKFNFGILFASGKDPKDEFKEWSAEWHALADEDRAQYQEMRDCIDPTPKNASERSARVRYLWGHIQ